METTKRKWGKALMEAQVFEPLDFVAACTVPDNMIWSPVPETNGEPGWQEHPGTFPIDTDTYPYAISSKHLGVSATGFTKRHIRGDDSTYPNDNSESYWEIKLTAPGIVYKKNSSGKYVETGKVYEVGQIFYRNYPDNVFAFDADKNFS